MSGAERERDEQGRPANARPRDRFGRPLPRGAADELSEWVQPEDVVASRDEALARAVALFDAERFFEAHEFLEYVWKSDEVASADRDFWKGVTQVAVGFVHVQRGNDDGALTLLERAVTFLRAYPSPHRGVDTRALTEAALAIIVRVREDGASPDHEFPPFPLTAGRDRRR